MGAGEWTAVGLFAATHLVVFGGWMFRMSSDLRSIKQTLESTEQHVNERHQENIAVQKNIWEHVTSQQRQIGKHGERLVRIETQLRLKADCEDE